VLTRFSPSNLVAELARLFEYTVHTQTADGIRTARATIR
jgi:hypothetical protein